MSINPILNIETNELYYYRARYYDAQTQRFISVDPIGFVSGDFNFYRYVGNSPIKLRDPLGLYDTSHMTDEQETVFVEAQMRRELRIMDNPQPSSNNHSGIDVDAYNRNIINRPRAMGGTGRMTDAQVESNDKALMTVGALGGFGTLVAKYGLAAAIEMTLAAFFNYGEVCDAMDGDRESRGRSGRGSNAVTRKSLEEKNRTTKTTKIGKIKW